MLTFERRYSAPKRLSARAFILVAVGVMAAAGSQHAHADLNNCENVYVGRIWIEKGDMLKAVVFLANPGDYGGSYWQYFTNWTVDEKKAALALLTSAKLSQHRVNLLTEAADQCSIIVGGQTMKAVFLSTNP